MKILMTGGTGLIGRHFIERYPDNHYVVLSRKKHLGIAPSQNITYKINLAGYSSLDDFDVVINLAGEPIIDKRWTPSQKEKICQSRWQITKMLVTLMAEGERPPRVFLSGSAIGYYGDTGARAVCEESHFSPSKLDFPQQVCSTWEDLASKARAVTRVVNMRTGVVLASDGGAYPKMRFPFGFHMGGRIGCGDQYMSWIHIDDIVAAMIFAIENSVEGPVNFTSPNPVTNNEFAKSLAKKVGSYSWCHVPTLMLKIMLGESAVLLTQSQRILPSVLEKNGFKFMYSQLDATIAALESNY